MCLHDAVVRPLVTGKYGDGLSIDDVWCLYTAQ